MGGKAPACLITRNARHSVRFRVALDLGVRLGRIEIVRALRTRNGRIARRVHGLWTLTRDRPALTTAERRRLANAWLRREVDREWRLLDSGAFARQAMPPGLGGAASGGPCGPGWEPFLGRQKRVASDLRYTTPTVC